MRCLLFTAHEYRAKRSEIDRMYLSRFQGLYLHSCIAVLARLRIFLSLIFFLRKHRYVTSSSGPLRASFHGCVCSRQDMYILFSYRCLLGIRYSLLTLMMWLHTSRCTVQLPTNKCINDYHNHYNGPENLCLQGICTLFITIHTIIIYLCRYNILRTQHSNNSRSISGNGHHAYPSANLSYWQTDIEI